MKALNIKGKNYNEEKVLELEKAMKETRSLRMYKRYSVVLKHFQGFTNRKIAEMERLDTHTVGTYIKNYKSNGLDGLVMNTSPGAPRTLTQKQEEQLVEIVTTKTPDQFGYKGRKNWTIELIRDWTNTEFNVDIKHSSMGVILHRLNLSYTRPTYVLKKADKDKQDKFIEDFKELKKTP